jgi:hypothetical protein
VLLIGFNLLPPTYPSWVRRRQSGYRPQPWHMRDFDSEVEVLLWRLDYRDEMPYGEVSMLKLSAISGQRPASGTPAAVDLGAERKFPAIITLLTATVGDDGKARKTSTLTIVCEDGLFKGGIRDREAQASLWRSSKTLDGLLKALEDALVGGEADWRPSETNSRK